MAQEVELSKSKEQEISNKLELDKIAEFPLSAEAYEKSINELSRFYFAKECHSGIVYENNHPRSLEKRKKFTFMLPDEVKKNDSGSLSKTAIKRYLEELYDFRNPSKTLSFIKENSIHLNLLKDTHNILKEFFPGSKLYLNVFEDPEGIDDEELVIYIDTNLETEEAITQLLRFNEKWCSIYSDEEIEKISVDVE